MKKQFSSLIVVILLTGFITVGCAKKKSYSSVSVAKDSEIPVDNARINFAEYEGKYKMQADDFDFVTVTMENGKLYGQASRLPKTELKYLRKDAFNIERIDATVTFTRNSQQQIDGVRVIYNGKQVVGQKVKE